MVSQSRATLISVCEFEHASQTEKKYCSKETYGVGISYSYLLALLSMERVTI